MPFPLHRLRLRANPLLPYPGEGRGRLRGFGGEFLELRPYAPGDDPRRIHWRAYAKTGRLYTRLERPPERARYRLFLDESPSMGLHGRGPYAAQVARLLLAIAKGEDPQARLEGGPLEALRPRRGEVLLLLTDGLDPFPWPQRLILVQILAPEELEPPFREALLKDVETGALLPVGPGEVAAYKGALAQHLRVLREKALPRGGYALLRVGEPPLPALLRQGVLELV